MITAAFATMMLAEQGAEAIKVEPVAAGDPMRVMGNQKNGMSGLFAGCNRGKRSIGVDLKQSEGLELVKQLVKDADVLIHNYRPGVMDKLGLSSAAMRELNPQLIYIAISGFGAEGPMKDAPAYDPVIQAQAGITASQGQGQPEFIRNLVCDKVTAYTACQAATAALFQRTRTGVGQHIDLSMLDAALFFIFPDGFIQHALLDEDVTEQPPLSEMLYNLTLTKDGGITASAATDQQRMAMLAAIDMMHLFEDERFNALDKLLQNLEAFRALVAKRFLEFTTDEAVELLRAADVPVARCLTHQEVLAQPQLLSNGTVSEVDHPHIGKLRLVHSPIRFAGELGEPALLPPMHAEHTAQVLAELGVSEQALEKLRQAGTIV